MAKGTATGRKASPVNDKMFEVEGSTSIGDAPPPGQLNASDVSFEDLGMLTDFPDSPALDVPDEGVGEYCVVLANFLSGPGEHDNFKQGDVRRISRLVPGYVEAKTEEQKNVVRGRVKRLLALKAIRKAAPEEAGMGHIDVSIDSESDLVQAERSRRIAAEEENAMLRERLGLAKAAQIAATPGQAGASEEAQQEMARQNAEQGHTSEEANWEDD